MGSCCKELEDILPLHLQDIKAPDIMSFPLSYNGNQTMLFGPLWTAERLIIIILNSLHDNPYGWVISEAGSNICFVILKIN